MSKKRSLAMTLQQRCKPSLTGVGDCTRILISLNTGSAVGQSSQAETKFQGLLQRCKFAEYLSRFSVSKPWIAISPARRLQDQISGTAALRQTQQTVGKCLTRA